jgi:phenylalanyl-tRNA synthetase alpha chain
MQNLEQIIQKILSNITIASDLKNLEDLRVKSLGKKGSLTGFLKSLNNLSAADKPIIGKKVNLAKQQVLEALEAKKIALSAQEIQAQLAETAIDVTLPGKNLNLGSIHPITKTIERLEKIFSCLGFDIAYGPEIENDYYNFSALNIPEHHPARAMQDTFYFPDGRLLRTHTSPVQIRAMQNTTPPIRLIAPGRVYRCESDVTHTPMFHQLEGLMVGEDLSFAHLKGVISKFLQVFFEQDLQTRFRPSYFPFTEPTAEVDMQCTNCASKGCRICKHTGWLEILGCGMVHPNVLKNCNIDSEKYTGWAFGIGIDRLAMLRYQIDDLRLMFENDLNFLEQFK